MKYEYKTVLSDVEVKLVSHISPSTPPTFEDPGDPGERYIEAVLLKNLRTGKDIDITDCFTEKDLDDLADEAYEDWQENRE